MGEFTDKVKGETNEAIGNLKQESNNPETREKGKLQEEKGEFQKDKGEVEGAEDLMKALKESKPYLFKAGTSTSSTDTKPKPTESKEKSAKDMTDAEWKAEKKRRGI